MIRPVTEDEALNLIIEVFKPYWPNESDAWFKKEIHYADYSLSLGYYLNEKLVGVYLLSGNNHPDSPFEGKGLEGMALAIKKEFQNQGIGSKLVRFAQSNPTFNYTWGVTAKKLNNKDFWLKHRAIIKEKDLESFISFQEFRPSDK